MGIDMERRDVLQRLLRIGGAVALTGAIFPRATGAAGLDRTPSQAEGPFYPLDKPGERDWDLLRRGGGNGLAAGQPLELSGRVIATDGRPVAGAVMEIWQADNNGVYDHPRAPGRATFDPSFQGYGATRIDDTGRYRFLTIVPVRYAGRPPHIHVKLRVGGQAVLTTQLYIKGHPDNDRDGIFGALRFGGKDALLMDLRPSRIAGAPTGQAVAFDFVV